MNLHQTLKAAASAAALSIGLGAMPALAADAVNVVSYGGSYTQAQADAFYGSFTAAKGVEVNSVDYSGGLAQIRAQVETGNVTWDVVDVTVSEAMRACEEGLVEVIPADALLPGTDGTPAEEDFLAGTLTECGVPNMVGSLLVAYDASEFSSEAPSTIADFFDLEKFPGKRGLRKSAFDLLEGALLADGVAQDDVYDLLSTPEGQDRAFAKLDTIKEHVIWWEASAQPPQLLADGEVVMTTAFNGRIYDAIVNEKKPFGVIWDGQVLGLNAWVVPKGSKNREAALDFVRHATSSESLANLSKHIAYGPPRASSAPLVDPKVMAFLPSAPEHVKGAVVEDAEFYADYLDELSERFNVWLAK